MKVAKGSSIDRLLDKVEIALPHEQLVLNRNVRVTAPEAQHLLFMPDLGLWFSNHDLHRAPNPSDLLNCPYYNFATERRVHNIRGLGSVGGWVKETTHIYFYFTDAKMAMLFKLAWGGK